MNGLTKIEDLEKTVSNLRVDLVHANQQNIRLLELLRRAHPNMHTCEAGQWFTDRDAAMAGAIISDSNNEWNKAALAMSRPPDPRDKRIEELEAGLEESVKALEWIGCRTEHNDNPKLHKCPVCECVDKTLATITALLKEGK